MKIIQANKYFFPKGGADKYMLELSDWLALQGHTVIPFAMRDEENFDSEYKNFFVSEFKNTPAMFPRMIYSREAKKKITRLIQMTKPDVAHIHNIYTQISPSILYALSRARVPVVMTVHDHHLISPQYNLWAEHCGKNIGNAGIIKATFSRFHKGSLSASFAQTFVYKLHKYFNAYQSNIRAFVCPSMYIKRKMIAAGFAESRLHLNHFGIDSKKIQPRYEHDGYILYVGRLSEGKGVKTVLNLAKALPDIKFKIAGRGEQMDYLHRYAIGSDNVEFLGFQSGESLWSLYKNACAVLIPSRVEEVFPLVALEAFASGTPVIASNVGGIPEIVHDRVNGFLIEPLDEHGWIEAVIRLLYDNESRERMSRNARETVETQFSISAHHERLMSLYQSVIKS